MEEMKNRLTYNHTLSGCMTGFVVQAINNNLTPLLFVVFQDEFGLDLSLLSSVILINFLTQLCVDAFAGKITDKFGFRVAVTLAMAVSALGLVLLGLLPLVWSNTFAALTISTVIFAIGGGLIEVVVSPLTELLPLGEKKSTMALLHSFYCWGQAVIVLLSTLFIKIFDSSLWYVLPFAWAIVPVANMIWFLLVPVADTIPEEKRTPLKALIKDKRFLLALIVMTCAGACELTVSQWSSLFAEKGLGVSKFLGDLLGPCLFAVLMGTGRLVFGLFGAKFNLLRVLKILASCCIACYLAMVFVPDPIISLLACGFTGLTVSMLWPGTISNTSARFPLGGTSMFGLCALFGDLGCAMGPGIAGLIADAVVDSEKLSLMASDFGLTAEQLGLRGGILVGTIFPVLLLICLFAIGNMDKHRRERESIPY